MKKRATNFKDFKQNFLNENKVESIYINTGSHRNASEVNRKAFSQLNELLLSDLNPYQELFQSETLILDDTSGFIGITSPNQIFFEYHRDDAERICSEISDFILEYLEPNDVPIIFGTLSYIFNDSR